MVLVFLSHFHLSIHYDVGIELKLALYQEKTTHIWDHILEWCKQKRLVKACIPPNFLLEWFLKYLLPYTSNEVSICGVASEEEAIFKSQ
jgi:hypothetical protein